MSSTEALGKIFRWMNFALPLGMVNCFIEQQSGE